MLLQSAGLSRPVKSYLKKIVENDGVPNLPAFLRSCFVPHKGPLKLQKCIHPAFALNLWVKAPANYIRSQSIALRVGVHPTLSARRATVMAVAKHHNLLAEDAAGRVVRADPGVEE